MLQSPPQESAKNMLMTMRRSGQEAPPERQQLARREEWRIGDPFCGISVHDLRVAVPLVEFDFIAFDFVLGRLVSYSVGPPSHE